MDELINNLTIMPIDWKHLATTTGYKSLKAAYIRDVQGSRRQKHPLRRKAEFLRKFQWVISRAKHYAYHTGESIESILNSWEEKRNYWWLNYYQECNQPKFHSYSIETKRANKDKSKKEKTRWPMARKKRGY